MPNHADFPICAVRPLTCETGPAGRLALPARPGDSLKERWSAPYPGRRRECGLPVAATGPLR
jgi:hypothetical protein